MCDASIQSGKKKDPDRPESTNSLRNGIRFLLTFGEVGVNKCLLCQNLAVTRDKDGRESQLTVRRR